MSKKRNTTLALALLCMLFSQILSLSALEHTKRSPSNNSYVPLWESTSQVIPSISTSGKTVYSSAQNTVK